MNEPKISIYGRLLDITIQSMLLIIEKMFPENRVTVIEQGTTLLSDGNVFECSIESNEEAFGESMYLAGHFYDNKNLFKDFLNKFIDELEKIHSIYDLDYEIKDENEYTEFNIRHPAFGERYNPPMS
jgi:hypothetical protein